MLGVVIRVVADRNAAHDLAAAAGQELNGRAVLVKRVLLRIDRRVGLDLEGRAPILVALINPPGEIDEISPLLAGAAVRVPVAPAAAGAAFTSDRRVPGCPLPGLKASSVLASTTFRP